MLRFRTAVDGLPIRAEHSSFLPKTTCREGPESAAPSRTRPHPCHAMRVSHASVPIKPALPLILLSRLETRLRGPTAKLIAGQKTNMSSPEPIGLEEERPPEAWYMGVSSIIGGEKAEGDRLSTCVREGASARAEAGVPAAARALCQAIVELDRAVEETNSPPGPISALVCLYDRVARGALLFCEGAGEGDGVWARTKCLEALKRMVEKAKEVNAGLSAKSRLARLSASKRKVERSLRALGDDLLEFARQHKPRLATTEEAYVSLFFTLPAQGLLLVPSRCLVSALPLPRALVNHGPSNSSSRSGNTDHEMICVTQVRRNRSGTS